MDSSQSESMFLEVCWTYYPETYPFNIAPDFLDDNIEGILTNMYIISKKGIMLEEIIKARINWTVTRYL